MTGYFISRKGKFRAYSQEAPKELVGHMLCTEKHMVKSSHRFCGGWREGNREECEHREIHLRNALAEDLRRGQEASNTATSKDPERNFKQNVPGAALQTGSQARKRPAPAWSGRPIWGKPDVQASTGAKADSGEKFSPARWSDKVVGSKERA